MEKFGTYFKQLRLDRSLSLREFCKRAEIDSSNWSKIERGLKTPPKSREELLRIVNPLDLTESDKEFLELIDLAAAESISQDLISDSRILDQLPVFFRTARGETPSAQELKKLYELIKFNNEPEI